MKTNRFFGLAALVGGFVMTLSSCNENDNPVDGKTTATEIISFENQTLNDDGYWMGDLNGTKFDNWGSEAYACQYKESILTFNTTYTPSWAAWMGYAISNRTATTFAAETMTPDQFNNITGTAKTGNKFCIVQTYGETIDVNVADGAYIKGFWYTNDAWTVDAILNGDGMTPGNFGATDWLKCTVKGTKADGTTAAVDIMLAENGDYVKEWQYADLSSLGKVKSLSFEFSGTKNNDYGLTTPAYMCIDDIAVEVEK